MKSIAMIRLGIVALLSVLAAGCSTAGRGRGAGGVPGPSGAAPNTSPAPGPTAGGDDYYGPRSSEASPAPIPSPAAVPPDTYGPERIQYRPIVLVLGPGRARGFAHVGVIRALHEAHIPIAAILGTEMGAFVGSLYAMEANLNRFEWSLQKFREEDFGRKGGLMSKLFDDAGGHRFEEDLGRVLGHKDLKTARIPLRIGLHLRDKDQVVFVSSGVAVDAIRAAMAGEGLFKPSPWEGSAADNVAVTRPFPIADARAIAGGNVVVVDVGGANAAALAELKDADLVIRPDLKGIAPEDFGRRSDAAFRGKDAVARQLKEIRHLVGLPENGDAP